MPRKTKVYFIRTTAPTGIHVDQPDHIVQCTAAVTATSQREAAERFGTTVHSLRTWGGNYDQDQTGLVPDAARARPGTVVYFPLDPRPGDTPVYGPTQLDYTAPVTVGEPWHQSMAQQARSGLADNQLADTSTDEELEAALAAIQEEPGVPYTVVPFQDSEWGTWHVAAVFPGHVAEWLEDGREGTVLHIMVEEGQDVWWAAERAANAKDG